MSSVREIVESYFATLNPTSERIMADMAFAKSQLEGNWDHLSPTEQEDFLWKSLVDPEIEKKYDKINPPSMDIDVFPVLRIKPGARIVVDEDTSTGKPFGSTWRDEHSAPFHWETQSQLNLALFDWEEREKPMPKSVVATPNDERRDVNDEPKRSHTIKRPEVPPPPVPPHFTPPVPPHAENSPPVSTSQLETEDNEAPIYAKVVKRKTSAKTLVISDMKAHKNALQSMKPAVPPRMSLELQLDINDLQFSQQSEETEAIPKTGFDFLDNW